MGPFDHAKLAGHEWPYAIGLNEDQKKDLKPTPID